MLDKYKEFREELKNLNGGLAAVKYVDSGLPNPLPMKFMSYSFFLDEQKREIANSLNAFRISILSVCAWHKVMDGLNDQEKVILLLESVGNTSSAVLNFPYAFKSRLIFSTAHLSHQANITKIEPWVDDLPNDEELYMKHAEQFSKNWKGFKKLKLKMEKINNKEYKNASFNYRDLYTHRIQPSIEVGLWGLAKREQQGAGYTYGSHAPISLELICSLGKEQYTACVEAYDAYLKLIDEQCIEISKFVSSS